VNDLCVCKEISENETLDAKMSQKVEHTGVNQAVILCASRDGPQTVLRDNATGPVRGAVLSKNGIDGNGRRGRGFRLRRFRTTTGTTASGKTSRAKRAKIVINYRH